MSTLIVFGENPEIDFLDFDAVPTITYSDGAAVTEHPIEEGADVADHIRLLPKELRLEAVVTDSPIVFARTLSEPADRPDAAYAILLDILDEKTPVDVITTRRSYENMVLSNLSVTRTASDGDGMRFVMAFRQVRFVDTETTEAVATKPASGDRAEGTTELGAQAAPAVPTGETSVLFDILGGF